MKIWVVTTPHNGEKEVHASKVLTQNGALILVDGEAVKAVFGPGGWLHVIPKEKAR